jgi:mandelamide amidase
MINVGKTNMHELAFGITTDNEFTGPARSFWNRDYSCGGSSGASGGVVGADIVPVALGTDTGGSIRIPSNNNGVFGYKPTINRWP